MVGKGVLMLESLATFILYNQYASLAIIGLFWGCIGIAILSPVQLLDSAYRVAKTPKYYHFRGYYLSRRKHHLRQAKMNALLFIASVSFLAGVLIGSRFIIY